MGFGCHKDLQWFESALFSILWSMSLFVIWSILLSYALLNISLLLGDAPLCPTFPPIFLRHLCIFLLIITSPRQSALVALIPESDGHVTQHSYRLFTILHLFHHFIISTPISWYIDMHPTLAGFYPFLLGSPARCAFLSYLCLYICLESPARSRLSRSAVALTLICLCLYLYKYLSCSM